MHTVYSCGSLDSVAHLFQGFLQNKENYIVVWATWYCKALESQNGGTWGLETTAL